MTIGYVVRKGTTYLCTPCPYKGEDKFGIITKVGSAACRACECNKGVDKEKQEVECAYKHKTEVKKMTMNITGDAGIDAILSRTLNSPAAKLKEAWKKDKNTILRFLDGNKDIPTAVVDALLMRVNTLSDYIEELE